MVLPAITAGARVAGTAARSARTIRRVGNRRGITDANQSQIRMLRTARNVRSQRNKFTAKNVLNDNTGAIAKKIRAVRASWTIGMFILPFYIVQLCFGILMLLGAGAEYAGEQILWGLGAIAIPGQMLFAASYLITTIVAVCLMGAAAFMYTFNGVTWWKGRQLVSFFLFMALNFVPFLNIAPWLAFWMATVVYAQK